MVGTALQSFLKVRLSRPPCTPSKAQEAALSCLLPEPFVRQSAQERHALDCLITQGCSEFSGCGFWPPLGPKLFCGVALVLKDAGLGETSAPSMIAPRTLARLPPPRGPTVAPEFTPQYL